MICRFATLVENLKLRQLSKPAMRRISILLLLAVFGLAVRAADVPAINDPATTDSFPGKFVWADLFTSDQAAAATFYTGLFGWTATTIDRTTPERGPLSYIVLSNGDRPVAGIALGPPALRNDVRGHWLGFVSVPDVTKALAEAVANGGHVLSPTREVPQRGVQAMFYSNEGAILGVLHSSSGDPGEYRPEVGDFTWAEVFAQNPGTAAQFYRNVLGYDAAAATEPSRPDTTLFSSGGYARASLAPLPNRPNAHPAWLLFVRVGSIADSLAKATQLGGRVLVQPVEVHGNSWIAIIADPVGAALGLVEKEKAAPTPAPAPPPAQP